MSVAAGCVSEVAETRRGPGRGCIATRRRPEQRNGRWSTVARSRLGAALSAIPGLAVLSFVDALESLQRSRELVVLAYLRFATQLGVFAALAWILV